MMLRRTLLPLAALAAFMTHAAAEARLTDFNGAWHGSGQDRDSPLQSLQDTTCQNAIRATLQRMNVEMTCDRKSGARKTLRMNVTLDGDQLSGRINQRVSEPGKEDAVLGGTLTGKKNGDTAILTVDWKGPTPTTSVSLRLNNPKSYSMKATALGMTFMETTFSRTSDQAPPRQPRQPRQ